MPDSITRIILRNGTEAERSSVTLYRSEPGYATNSKRLYIGDGTTVGGNPVGVRNLGFARFQSGIVSFGADPAVPVNPVNLAPTIGDLIVDVNTTILYTLTGTDYNATSNYAKFGSSLGADNITIQSSQGVVSVKPGSLTFGYFNPFYIGRGLELTNSNLTIQIKNPSPELRFNVEGGLAINENGVTNNKLALMPSFTIKGNKNLTTSIAQDLTVTELSQMLAPSILQPSIGPLVPVGTIIDFAGGPLPGVNYAQVIPQPWLPPGYLLCDGSAVSRATYAALFAVLGTLWGAGDNTTTFNVPDLRGRAAIGAGANPLLTQRSIGTYLGAEKHLLTPNETALREHRHQQNYGPQFTTSTGKDLSRRSALGLDTASPLGAPNTQGVLDGAKVAIEAHNNMQPSAVVYKIIKF